MFGFARSLSSLRDPRAISAWIKAKEDWLTVNYHWIPLIQRKPPNQYLSFHLRSKDDAQLANRRIPFCRSSTSAKMPGGVMWYVLVLAL
jgi:hypothetical protein